MKTQKELKILQKEYNSLTAKLQELTEEELKIVIGGGSFDLLLTYWTTGGCGFLSEIRKTTNICTQSNICSHTNVECQYR